jgi:hypothetical protein
MILGQRGFVDAEFEVGPRTVDQPQQQCCNMMSCGIITSVACASAVDDQREVIDHRGHASGFAREGEGTVALGA